jgi:hypothetical protein
MSKFLDFLSYVFEYFDRKPKNILSKHQSITIFPDGTWTLNCANSKVKDSPSNTKLDDMSKVVTSISEPPKFFPNAVGLKTELFNCYCSNVIQSYRHELCKNDIYLLHIEFSTTHSKMSNFKKMIKYMEKHYNFTLIQQNQKMSLNSGDMYYIAVFEYDQKKTLF